jgi:hypothetical protein
MQPINAGSEASGMKKLDRLRQWLTVAEAARHLGILFGEDVSEADVLRLALDGQLTLSVYFVNHSRGRCGPVVPLREAKRHVIQIRENEWLHSIDGLAIGEDRVIEYDPQPVVLDGIWDLTMAGAERLDVEHHYQQLTGGRGPSPTCAESTMRSRQINGIAEKLALHFWCGLVRR